MRSSNEKVTKRGVIMQFQYDKEKEEAILTAKEKVTEAADVLEEALPDTAEELNWIRSQLVQELMRLQNRMTLQADGVLPAGECYYDL
jgi:uncharacterized protein with HEPN domain